MMQLHTCMNLKANVEQKGKAQKGKCHYNSIYLKFKNMQKSTVLFFKHWHVCDMSVYVLNSSPPCAHPVLALS